MCTAPGWLWPPLPGGNAAAETPRRAAGEARPPAEPRAPAPPPFWVAAVADTSGSRGCAGAGFALAQFI